MSVNLKNECIETVADVKNVGKMFAVNQNQKFAPL